MLLAFDLDKTIVTEEFELPGEIESAIRGARDAGHLVTVLTGRPKAAAEPFLTQLDVAGPYSVNHGALVMGVGDEVLKRRRLPATAVTQLLSRYHDDPSLEFSCIVDDVLYVRDPRDERWAWAHTLNRRVERFELERSGHADKIVFSANGASERLEREIRGRHPDFITYAWGDGYLEVTAPDADKGAALQLICRTLGVARNEVIAFGDGVNDVTMLRWAGHAVAVGPHAHPEVLAAAAEHIPGPEAHGVAAWLQRRFG